MSRTQSGRKTGQDGTMDSKMLASTSSREKLGQASLTESLGRFEIQDSEQAVEPVIASMETIALKALHIDDDSSLNPWTFRMFFLGIGLSGFGSTLATIFLFKPQPMFISVIFLTVISYVIGNGMSLIIPRHGFIGRWFNPHSFNSKEHLAIVIMSSSASSVAHAVEVFALQKLYYNTLPNVSFAILLLFSSQLLGYGMAGVLRKSLVYPTKMVWPSILPLSSLIETLHREKGEIKKKLKLFWVVFGVVAVWELFPQYVMPVLTGVSFFCLANRKSLVFTNIFGGSSGNEGLGLLAFGFDWLFISTRPLFTPLIALSNCFIGYVIGVGLFLFLYYGNVWNASQFPFLSQELFSRTSNSSHFVVYEQNKIINGNKEIDPAALETIGLPFFATSYAAHLVTTNLGVTATITHILLWNGDSVSKIFKVISMSTIKSFRPNIKFWKKNTRNLRTERRDDGTEETDPHYRQMLAYAEVPSWWYMAILGLSMAVALFCIYNLMSTLPWWGFLIACALSFISTLFSGVLSGILGFSMPINGVIQLIGGYLHPGQPTANMYFVLFGANSQSQALSLIESLKLGQYGKLSPKCTFSVQIIGTVFGAIINYFVMSSITTHQRDILLSIGGSHIWSGRNIQSLNSDAIAFGGLSHHLFDIGCTYQWVVLALPLGFLLPLPFYFAHHFFPKVGFNYIITPVISGFIGILTFGINSCITVTFMIGFYIQFYARKRYPSWFLKYNYILAAAISGGTEFLVFITTFAVQGSIGRAVPFPPYWGNNHDNFQTRYLDYCATNPAMR